MFGQHIWWKPNTAYEHKQLIPTVNYFTLNIHGQGAICRRMRFAGGDSRLLNYFYPRWGQNLYPHLKYFHHYIVIINNQNTKGPCSFWLCCDFDLPGASQRRRRKQFYFENQPDFFAFHKSNFLSASSAPKQKLKSNEKKLKESTAAYHHILQDHNKKYNRRWNKS